MTNKDQSNDRVNRREVLRAGGTAGALLVGSSAIAGGASADRAEAEGGTRFQAVADDEELRAYEDYADDPELVRRTFEDQVDPVRRMLASAGMPVPGSLDEAIEFDVAPGRIDGDPSAHIVARFEHEREVTVHVYPHAERAFARVATDETFDDGQVKKQEFDPLEGVTTLGCFKECVRAGYSTCGLEIQEWLVYNCCTIPGDPDCEQGTCCTYEGSICSPYPYCS